METLAQKEKIIAKKVEEYKASTNKLSFYVSGGGYTRLIRDAWLSDLVAHAIDKLGVEGLGCTRQQALQICTGQKMLIGDSRIKSYPGGIEMVDDDGRFEHYELPSAKEMINRQTRKLFNSFGRLSANWRDKDVYFLIPTYAMYSLKGPFKFGTGRGAQVIAEAFEKEKEHVQEALTSLQILYELSDDSFRSLDFSKFETALSKFESEKVRQEWEEFEENRDIRDRLEAEAKERHQEKQPTKAERIKKAKTKLESAKVEYSRQFSEKREDKLKNTHSAWLLPDGTLYGGPPVPYIHDAIVDNLEIIGFFKDKEYSSDLKDLEERGGWIKLSGGKWLYFPREDEDGKLKYLTQRQLNVLVDWALAHECKSIELSLKRISMEELLEASTRTLHSIAKYER